MPERPYGKTAEALAYLVDPSDLVSDVPGADSRRHPGRSERRHDPDAEWDPERTMGRRGRLPHPGMTRR